MKVSAKTKAKPNPVTVEVNIPEGTDNLVKAYGTEVVGSAAQGAIIISLQAFMRRLIEKGKNQVEIQAEASKWKPDVRTIVKQTALERATAGLDKLSDEERKALFAKYAQKK